ncbi:FG-GAP-like repeat-containing protein, partial [Hymenobacter siberiensis]|uniref:FG-GAP-like repeat-containing protein n=1 Tax=Hymenobacter siberiensis TaxID=2848396 RepID=UPI001C1E4237
PAVGSSPVSVAVGDVDGDGDLDLLTANQGSNTVSVRLNDGTGNFTAPATNPNPAVGTSPRSVAVGDVDGDGDLDLLTANYGSSTVSVRLNDGTGNFTAPATNPNPAVGANPVSVAVGDVDGDGDLDLLTANLNNNTVSVRLNDGTGNFTAPATNPDPAVGTNPISVAVGDVDGDGDLDLLTANQGSNTVSVRLNDGTGNFTAPATNPNPAVGSSPSSVAVGDVDGDGDLDLLTTNRNDNTVSVRLNRAPVPAITSFTPGSGPAGTTISLTGTGLTGATAITFSGTSGNVVTTGFTVVSGTSITGVVVPAGAITGPLTVTTAGGTSAASITSFTVPFTISSTSPARNARAAALATPVGVTFSAALDAATSGNIRVFSQQYRGRRTATANTSGATATLTPTVPATGSQVAGFKPGETLFVTVPASVRSTGGVAAVKQVYQFTTATGGTGTGYFMAPATNPNPAVGTEPRSVAVGDVDGDGDLDLLTANQFDNTVSVRLNDGTGNFTAPTTNPNPAVGKFPTSVAVGDVDGDGDLDLLTANQGSNTVSVRLNDGTGNFTAPATNPNPAVGTEPYSVAVGDVDGDGDLDLLTANLSGTVSVRLNDGTGNFTAPATNPNPAVGANPVSVAVGDMDGDGDLDLLTANLNNNTVSVRLNDGTGNFTAPTTNPNPAVGSSPINVAVGDVDGDGDLDLLTANTGDATVSVRLNDGTGNFTAPATNADPAVGTNPISVAVGDVDGDGDLDLLTANQGSNTVSVRLNDGTGNFTAPATNPNPNPAVGSGPRSVAVGDMDGDGDLDLLTADFKGNTVSVRLNQAQAPAITSISPTPGVRGEAVTVTGTNLGSVTSVSVNGASATAASFVSNTATSLTFQVPTTAGASGTTSVTTAGGTASTATFTTVAATPPGNALAFDGVDDFVPFGSTPAVNNLGPGSFTLEAWVYYDGSTGAHSIIRKDGDYNFYINGNTLHSEVWSSGTSSPTWQRIDASTTALPANRWAHVAAVWNGSTMKLFVNGALEISTTTAGSISASANLTLGKSLIYGNLLTGRLDEVRIYTAALTPANIQADMVSTASAVPGSLKFYLNFDQGTAGGNNAGQTTLYDQSSNAYAGTLTNFALTGTTSNYVESYALVVPTATAATAIANTTFTANWTAPALGTVTNYLLDVSTAVNFSSAAPGSPFTVAAPTLSKAVTGLAASTTYYYRVRADKTSVTGQGDYSNVTTVATCAPPVAIAQNASVTLDVNGNATVAATAVNNGSTANCGPALAGSLSVSPSSFSCANLGANAVTLTVTDNGGNIATASATVTVTVPATPTTTWNGSLSTTPLACQNWSYGQVPDAATNVVVPTGQPRYPILTTGTLATKDLTINAGGSFTANGGTALQVSGNLANNGTATFSGPVQFVGSTATQTLSNGGGFNTMVVNKPSGTVQLAQSLTINAGLTLSSGTLTTTSSYQVNLGGAASLSESETSYVLGKTVVNRTLVPGAAEPFAGLGLTLTPAVGSTAPGATLVTRTTGTAIAGAGTSQSILRSFDIQPTTNTGLNVTMDFAYFDHERNGIPTANLALFKSVSGGTPWIPQRGTTAGANVMTKTGIADFSVWTLGNAANPLPVELTDFTATALTHAVRLQWRTASEKNTARFDVERSGDGTAFDLLGKVAAAGTSTTPREYALTDAQLPAGIATLYYRLKQVDQDGSFSYSPVHSVRLSEAAAGLVLYPNPATARTMLTGTQPGTLVQVFDAVGRVVASATADATGTATLPLPTGIATGVYVVRTGNKALRLTVE